MSAVEPKLCGFCGRLVTSGHLLVDEQDDDTAALCHLCWDLLHVPVPDCIANDEALTVIKRQLRLAGLADAACRAN